MLTFFHAPHSRSSATHWLLAELGVPYETRIVDIRSAAGVPVSYRSIQAHGKVPAIIHDGVTVTERAAIAAYLADAFPQAGLAPAIGDRRRGPYLSWLAYVDAVLDPAICAHLNGWDYDPRGVSFGRLSDALSHIERTLAASPYVVGERFTAADTALGSAVYWGLDILKVIPETPVFRGYLNRVSRRASFHATIGSDAVESMAEAA